MTTDLHAPQANPMSADMATGTPPAPPRVCIVGPGAIGGWLGATLAHAGVAQVSALARGQTLTALQIHGWRTRLGDQLKTAPAKVSDRASALGAQDVVFLTVKGPALAQVAAGLAPLITPQTLIVPAMNGVPWWFCDALPQTDARTDPVALQQALDPTGELRQLFPSSQVLGCAVHVSASTPEPGLAVQHAGNKLVIGEPTGAPQTRTRQLADCLAAAGIDVVLSPDIRQLIWSKLLGNLTMNPISALTGANTAQILDDAPTNALCLAVMQEAVRIGARLGCDLDPGELPARLQLFRQSGPIRTSMLQDLEAGRPLELEAIVGTVVRLGQALGEPCPSLSALYALCGLMGERLGLYQRPRF